MKHFLYDLHVHTAESSSCAKAQAADVVGHYKKSGYSGIVITDHMNAYKMAKKGLFTIEQKAEYLLKGYREAKKYETEDFRILLGMELEFKKIESDFLVYGFDEDFLFTRHFDLIEDLESFRPIADEYGLLVFQAHPFRFDMVIQNPKLLDGMEVYNGNAGHQSNNDIAALWAKRYDLRPISGSDYHGKSEPTGGVLFEERISDSTTLNKNLREKKYRIISE